MKELTKLSSELLLPKEDSITKESNNLRGWLSISTQVQHVTNTVLLTALSTKDSMLVQPISTILNAHTTTDAP